MKLLLFSDLHQDEAACAGLLKKASQADVVIGAGDFASFRRGLEKTIQQLCTIKTPTLLVFGNHENEAELIRACRCWPAAQVLHGREFTVKGISFFGIGGATPVTPFSGQWSVDVPEEEAAQLLSQAPKGGVLITHSPPLNCLDRAGTGQHLGSHAIRHHIENTSPALVVCGHIHETWQCRDTIGEVPVINPGPRGIFVTLDTSHARHPDHLPDHLKDKDLP